MKTVLITGATDGIGRETARQLLTRGFRVLVHGRTLEKAQRVVVEFQRAQPEAAAEAVPAFPPAIRTRIFRSTSSGERAASRSSRKRSVVRERNAPS